MCPTRPRRRVLRRTPSREFVEDRAQFEDLVGFVDADLAHEHAPILFEPHETRFLERAKRLAHRAARHAEHRRHFGFAKLRPCGKVTGENHPLELALHEPRQRVRLNQRDRVVVADRAAPDGAGHGGDRGGRGVLRR
jgi:hypothetical protein